MKQRVIMATVAVVATVISLTQVYAETGEPTRDMMRENSRMMEPDSQSKKEFQQTMYQQMMEKYAPNWEMMGGYGMGAGAMQGYGMKHGYGMGPGMMGGGGYCQGPIHMWNYQSEEYNTYMNETKDIRKKLHDLQFEYGEMMRNPKTTIADLRNKQKEMYELQKELRKKALDN